MCLIERYCRSFLTQKAVRHCITFKYPFSEKNRFLSSCRQNHLLTPTEQNTACPQSSCCHINILCPDCPRLRFMIHDCVCVINFLFIIICQMNVRYCPTPITDYCHLTQSRQLEESGHLAY